MKLVVNKMLIESNEFTSEKIRGTFLIKRKKDFLTEKEIEGLVYELSVITLGYEIEKKANVYNLKCVDGTIRLEQSTNYKGLEIAVNISSEGSMNYVQKFVDKSYVLIDKYFSSFKIPTKTIKQSLNDIFEKLFEMN